MCSTTCAQRSSVLGATGVGQNAVEGRVYFDVNQNRQMDPGEPGQPGIEVWIDYNDDGSRTTANETTTTLADDGQTPW